MIRRRRVGVAMAVGAVVAGLLGGAPRCWSRAGGSEAPGVEAQIGLQAPPLWGGLEPGPFGVGFSTIFERDEKRKVPGTQNPRPILISLWYPASDLTNASPLSYRDYIAASADEGRLQPATSEERNDAVAAYTGMVASTGIGIGPIETWLSSPMAAVQDAPPAEGRFPLVVILPGTFHTFYHHAILAEVLASHGFVVAVAPSQSRLDGPPREGDDVLEAVRQQKRDVKVALQRMQHDDRVAPGHVGLVAHSFGARAAFLIALEEPVAGLVSLDGGIASSRGLGWLDGVPFDAADFEVPVLHIYQDSDDAIHPDFDLLRSLVSSDRLLVRIDDFTHLEFTSLGMVFGLIPGMSSEETSPMVVEKARAVMRLTLWFLERTLHQRAVGAPPSEVVDRPWIEVVRLR